MTNEQALWTIVQLYDKDYPDDLRAAGHHAKAQWLEVVIDNLIKGTDWPDKAQQLNIELAKFMQLCSEQRDGS